MSSIINTPTYSVYDNYAKSCDTFGDKLSKHVQRILSKSGISGSVELGMNEDGRATVLNAHPQKADIENILNSDSKFVSMYNLSTSTSSTKENKGKRNENSHGDSVCLSRLVQETKPKMRNGYLGSIVCEQPKSVEEYFKSIQENAYGPADEKHQIKEYKLSCKFPTNAIESKYNSTTGKYESQLNDAIAYRGMVQDTTPGKSAVVQEKNRLEYASTVRKKAYDQLHAEMKKSGIELKQGQKINFIMDQDGKITVDPKSNADKDISSKIEMILNESSSASTSVKEFLLLAESGNSASPAAMRMQIDAVLQEYTGKGFDDLEWSANGDLIWPEGFCDALGQYPGLSRTVCHLKSLQESEGESIFKSELSFTITSSGIVNDKLSRNAVSNLFDDSKMVDNRLVYNDRTVNPGIIAYLDMSKVREDNDRQFAMKTLIQTPGTSVYLTSSADSSYSVDKNGNRQMLPSRSDNYNATARYLIEDYLVGNGIQGNLSDYAVRINGTGRYEVVPIAK